MPYSFNHLATLMLLRFGNRNVMLQDSIWKASLLSSPLLSSPLFCRSVYNILISIELAFGLLDYGLFGNSLSVF